MFGQRLDHINLYIWVLDSFFYSGQSEAQARRQVVRRLIQQALSSNSTNDDNQNSVVSELLDSKWQSNNQIIEAEGIYKLENGQVVWSRQCPNLLGAIVGSNYHTYNQFPTKTNAPQ